MLYPTFGVTNPAWGIEGPQKLFDCPGYEGPQQLFWPGREGPQIFPHTPGVTTPGTTTDGAQQFDELPTVGPQHPVVLYPGTTVPVKGKEGAQQPLCWPGRVGPQHPVLYPPTTPGVVIVGAQQLLIPPPTEGPQIPGVTTPFGAIVGPQQLLLVPPTEGAQHALVLYPLTPGATATGVKLGVQQLLKLPFDPQELDWVGRLGPQHPVLTTPGVTTVGAQQLLIPPPIDGPQIPGVTTPGETTDGAQQFDEFPIDGWQQPVVLYPGVIVPVKGNEGAQHPVFCWTGRLGPHQLFDCPGREGAQQSLCCPGRFGPHNPVLYPVPTTCGVTTDGVQQLLIPPTDGPQKDPVLYWGFTIPIWFPTVGAQQVEILGAPKPVGPQHPLLLVTPTNWGVAPGAMLGPQQSLIPPCE